MKRMKELRKERRLTQQDVADVLGIDRTTYAKYETGVNEPSLDNLRHLATFFQVTTDYLLGLTGERHARTDLYDLSPIAIDVDALTPRDRESLADYAKFLMHKDDT